MLAGHFLGNAHRDGAEALATALAAPDGAFLRAWFGADGAAALCADGRRLRGALDRDVAAIDALMGAQLDAVLHAPRLRELEGRWRGLWWLAGQVDPTARIKLRLLPARWAELCRDLERAAEFDQSILFRRIYEDEFGTPGGEPFGLLLLDHAMRHRPAAAAPTDDVAGLAQLMAVAAAAFAVAVVPASPALLDADGFSDLALSADPASPLRGRLHERWVRLGAREDARFLCVVAPPVLARPPWEDDGARHDGFRYAEHAPEARSRAWMSAIYPFAATVARAFANHAWPADVRGVDVDREGGSLVTGLPVEEYRTDPPGVWPRPPVELGLNDTQERSLIEGGLMPLVGLPHTADAAFASVRSLQAPAPHSGQGAALADANARIASRISAMLCAARFAHYVKVIGRDMVGSLQTAELIEARLQEWLNGYVNASIDAGPDTRARHPLLAGRVSVRERPGRPGVFGCVVQLQPHFQLDDVAASFRLVTEVSAPGRAA